MQHTINQPVSFSGFGIHTGVETSITCLPAPANHGVKFQRMDLEGQPIVEALVQNVVDVTRSTTLCHNNAYIDTVEHLLAALAGSQIDNMLIQVKGPEIPILDGSALPFVKAFQQTGTINQGVERRFFQISEHIYYKDEKGSVLSVFAAEEYSLAVMVDYDINLLYNQHAYLSHISDFAPEIAPCRTFAFLSELQSLYEHGLVRGGSLDNALVLIDKTLSEQDLADLSKMFNKNMGELFTQGAVLNNTNMHFPNEPARHKLLDLMGDLMLLGRPIKGYVIGYRPGHAANVEFVKKLHKAMLQQEDLTIPVYNPNQEPIFSNQAITNLLPHRYPFQLVDKVIQLDKRTITGVKNVTINEPFFQGHFPNHPVMPGVLQVEAMVQTGGILVLSNVPNPQDYSTYFLAIENCRFKRKVLPGDTLLLRCELITDIKRGIVKMRGRAFVGDKLTCEAIMTAQIVKKHE
jgi:UDP-3-O-[3-hydroxymyristoyl] N-acetylglucosamine deacetylase/3-hydroxyacyl-[acyl-carrier-protein] dehydratase